MLTFSISCSNPSSVPAGTPQGTSPTEPEAPTSPDTPTTATPPSTPETPPVTNYTITFNANNAGATGSTANITAAADTIVTLTTNGFSLEGYTFTGWNTAADGSGTTFFDETNLSLTNDLLLYAQWISLEGAKYAISLGTIENGTVNINKTEAVAGDTIRIILNNNENYVFKSLLIVTSDGNRIIPTIDTYDWKKCYFTMPNQVVTITVSFSIEHIITLKQPNGVAGIIQGNLESNKTQAVEGSVITITVVTHEFYITQSITIKDQAGNTIESIVNSNNSNTFSFNMPDQDVYVEGVFLRIAKPIFVRSFENGRVTLNKRDAVPGTEIEVSFIPNESYVLGSFEIKGADDGITIESTVSQTDGNTYKFIMPDKRVEIIVSFIYGAHTITVADSEYANITVNKSTAVAGTEIEISVIQNESCRVQDVLIVDNEGNTILRPTKQGESNVYKFIMPDMNVIVDPQLPLHTITFVTNSTTSVESQILEHGKTANSTTVSEDRIHKGFLGWYLEPECNNSYNFNKPVINDMTLYAKWESLNIDMLMDDVETSIKALKYSSKVIVNRTKTLHQDNEIKKALDYLYSVNPQIEINLTLHYTTAGYQIYMYAFQDCMNLVILSVSSASRINHFAFKGCKKLKKVYLNGIYTMDESIFMDCSSLEYFAYGQSTIPVIGKNVFHGCSNLPNIQIPVTVNQIWPYAFYRCDKLQDVFFTDSQSTWQIKESIDGEVITTVQVNNSTQNATLLKTTYARYYWVKVEE